MKTRDSRSFLLHFWTMDFNEKHELNHDTYENVLQERQHKY